MIAKRMMIAAFFASLAGGCLPPDPNIGTGPVALSPNVQANYQDYLETRSPGYFAITQDGSGSFYNYCSAGRCYKTSSNSVIHECEKINPGKSCKVYASKGQVVWQTEGALAAN
ncbi:MAG: hypothetical protein HC871_02190 [Rhizobiales bacterium]|nr:hypothetical protein [Hyphomicrobiales bacterium]